MGVPPSVDALVAAARTVHAWFNASPDERAAGAAAGAPAGGTGPRGGDGPEPPPGPAVPLPRHDADPPTAPLADVLHARRARYDFTGATLDARDLGALLHLALGPGRRVTAPDGSVRDLGPAPSAGGLPSLDAYVVLHRAAAPVPAGVHRYARGEHALVPVRVGDPVAGLRATYLQPEFATRPAASVLLVGRLDRTLPRYGLRHYTTLHVDAGIALQNLWLVATALGLAGCAVSGIRSDPASALLALPAHGVPLVAFAVGPGAATA